MWQRVSRTDRMTDASPHITWVFSSSYKLQQTLPVTTLLLFGPVTLLCGSLLFHLKTEGSVQLSDCEHHQTDSSLIHTASFSMHTDTPTLWLWYYLWRRIRAAELPPLHICNFHTDSNPENWRMNPWRAVWMELLTNSRSLIQEEKMAEENMKRRSSNPHCQLLSALSPHGYTHIPHLSLLLQPSAVAPFTESRNIIAAAAVCQPSTIGHSHRAGQRRLNRRDGRMMMSVCVKGVSQESSC